MSNTLTNHFATLKLFQKVLRLSGIVSTIFSIIGIAYLLDAFPLTPPIVLSVIIIVISILFMWYGILNTIIMVNFLFELDKNKTNKN